MNPIEPLFRRALLRVQTLATWVSRAPAVDLTLQGSVRVLGGGIPMFRLQYQMDRAVTMD